MRHRCLVFTFTVAIIVAVATGGCSPAAPSDLRGGVLATFTVGDEPFTVFVTNPVAISQLFQLQQGLSLASIPNGRLRHGPGAGAHNAPFSWHLDPDDIQMAGFTIELCDGRPSFVEAHVNEYANVIGRYCPWGARLVELIDLR